MILERKMIREHAFKLLVEAGLFDDYEDSTEALIPYYLSPEQKQALMDRYDKMGVPYVVQTHPDDQPNPDDIMNPPRTNRQIRRDVLKSADDIEAARLEKMHQDMLRSAKRDEEEFADPSEKTMPVSRMKRLAHLEKAEDTFNTSMLDDYEDYSYEFSNPAGADARFHDSHEDSESDETTEKTFNFDLFNKSLEDDISMPYIDPDDPDGDELRENTMSRGALIRKRYYGRY